MVSEISLPTLTLKGGPNKARQRTPTAAQNDAVVGVADLPTPTNVSDRHPSPGETRKKRPLEDNKEPDSKRPKLGEMKLDLEPPSVPASTPRGAKSLHSVLKQALISTDTRMLEVCLQSHKQETITNTVKRLSSDEATQLLEKLVDIFRKQHRRAGDLFPWLRTLLYTHPDTLLDSPAHFRLKQAIDYRIQWLMPLLKFQGRLDFYFHRNFSLNDRPPPPSPDNVYEDSDEEESED